ncbi:hypothetical protein HDC94_002072 [Leifsonia sp. AK011]|uniref:hypothetical protein n=1 Tax=Leifsonia sp. AK011 TaxID=2723075 RepID=UPI0015CC81C2|nr:hypothetical protein [Leifsonia sp. AK011]NYF10916.1 hypothetical protein [Leifsonia sp. AK011]
MTDLSPEAVEHSDGLEPSPPCETCGSPKELVMLERFTGWWCRSCAEQAAGTSA